MLDWPKADTPLGIVHEGKGKPWVTLQSLAAIPLKKPFSSGYNITRSVTAIERKQPNAWTRGDVMRIRLDVDAQTDMTWVVVDDPIPAGSSIMGTGLAKDSQILTQGEKKQGWVWPAFEERKFDAFRAYYQFVPKGKFSLEYSVRLNNAGEFQMPQTRVEAMYSPELFGEIPGQNISITN